MARYRVTGQMYYRRGEKTLPGEEVVIPNDEAPVASWVPLDDAARAAVERLTSVRTSKPAPAPAAVVLEQPKPKAGKS